jgi:Tfp pilus assembly protein PilE
MIEMLGVLAIVGVLSVGGLVGYTKAMDRYKINQAVDEINKLIVSIKDLYADKNNYLGINKAQLINVGLISDDGYNVFGLSITVLDSDSPSHYLDESFFKLNYAIPGQSQCQKLLLSGFERYVPYPGYLFAYDSDVPTTYFFKWDGTGTYDMPPQIADVMVACENADSIGFYSK